jgi:hypothetical protein
MANKLKYYDTLGMEGLPVAKTLFYFAHLQVTKKVLSCEYGPGIYQCFAEKA